MEKQIINILHLKVRQKLQHHNFYHLKGLILQKLQTLVIYLFKHIIIKL